MTDFQIEITVFISVGHDFDFRRLKSTKVASKSSRVKFTKSTKVNELRDIFKAVKNYKFKKILSPYQLFITKIKSFF